MGDMTCEKKLGIGIIGFGNMGKAHLFSINSLSLFYENSDFSASVRALCTAHPKKAESIAQKYGIVAAYENEDALIEADDIDVVDICTPNIYHFETVKKAIAAGKHVLCEKPLCVTRDEAIELLELSKQAEQNGQICGVVFNNRFLSPIVKAKELIENGRLGRILSFRAEYLHNSCLDLGKKAGWKQTKEFGGGVLYDLGSHVIDLIYYLCGEFYSVFGTKQIAFSKRLGIDGKTWTTNADEAFYMTATLKNGAKGTITASKLTMGANDDLTIEIFGTEGALRFSLMEPNWLYFYDGSAVSISGYTKIECVQRYGSICSFPSPKAPQGWLRGHIGSMYSYLDCVAHGKRFSPSFEDSRHVISIISAAYDSADSETVKLV